MSWYAQLQLRSIKRELKSNDVKFVSVISKSGSKTEYEKKEFLNSLTESFAQNIVHFIIVKHTMIIAVQSYTA